MRPDESFLRDIARNTQLLTDFVTDITRESFYQDEMRQMAVEKGIERIGEAMKNVSENLKLKHSHVDWSGFPKMRDRMAHGYWSVDYSIVWDTVTQEIPILHEQVRLILALEFEEG